VPDAFTHGTSAQRVHWFRLGYTTGDVSKGNTFDALQADLKVSKSSALMASANSE
jgi:predicted metalloprotease